MLDAAPSIVPDGRIAYRPAEAAELVGCSRGFIYLQMQSGALKTIRVGRARLITRDDLVAWLESNRDTPGVAATAS